MTLITFEDGNVVFRDGKAGTGQECCCEQPLCPYCSASCLEVTLTGFSSTAEGCDCADINDTYILTRGDGCLPRVVALVVDDDGTGAVLSVTLAFDAATGTYYVASVTIVSAGDDYSSASSVDLSIVGGQVFNGNAPVISVASEREEPDAVELIVVPGSLGTGSGAELTPTWATSNTTAGSETWTVTAVTVANGGTEYEELSQVRFPTDSDLETKYRVEAFDGFTNVDHAEPVVDTITITTSGGSGATLSITWENDATITDFIQTANPGADGRHWKVASVNVISGGSGYAENDAVSFSLDGRHIDYALNTPQASYLIGSAVVDGSGAITSVPIGFTNPSLYRSDGIIQSVVIEDGGEYYQNTGITTATVENGGTIIATGTAEGGGEGGGDFLPGCLYSYCGDIDCGGTEVCLRVSLGIAADTRVLKVELGGTAVAQAEISADGNACDSMAFASGDFDALGCTPGSASVAAAACASGAAEDVCCCRCTCADFAASGAIWPPAVTINGQAITSDPWVTIATEFCDGTSAADGLCLFAGERCWAGASRRFVCKPSYSLPNAVANDNGVGQTLDAWMEDDVLYLILAVFLASGQTGTPRCFLFDEYRLYKINADLCCTENADPAPLSLERIINLRGQAGRGDDLTGTPLAGLGYPIAPDDDPTLCSCHASFFLDPVVSINCNPLP